MSTKAKVTRPTKKATVAAPTSVVMPTPEVPVVPAVLVDTPVEGAHKTRVQTNKAIGVSISAARSRRHLDKLNLNLVLDMAIKEPKSQIQAYKAAKSQLETLKVPCVTEVDGKKIHELRDATADEQAAASATVAAIEPQLAVLESRIASLSRERTRFSNEAAIVLSITCDELTQQLAEHTMNRVLLCKKKIIQISHLHESGIEALSLYPLIKTLPSFVKTSAEFARIEQEDKTAALLAAALAQAEKDFKKKYEVTAPKKKKEAEPEATPEAVETDEEDVADSKTSFRFYVHQVCKTVTARDPKFADVRVSTAIRGYLSDLLVELIQRISPLVLLTANSMKNKTVNDVAILRTIEFLLIDGHKQLETIDVNATKVQDPAALKEAIQKRDDEKKAGREYKIDLEALPKVDGFFAVRHVSYPTSGYEPLAEKVKAKLALFETLSQKDKAALVEA